MLSNMEISLLFDLPSKKGSKSEPCPNNTESRNLDTLGSCSNLSVTYDNLTAMKSEGIRHRKKETIIFVINI